MTGLECHIWALCQPADVEFKAQCSGARKAQSGFCLLIRSQAQPHNPLPHCRPTLDQSELERLRQSVP